MIAGRFSIIYEVISRAFICRSQIRADDFCSGHTGSRRKQPNVSCAYTKRQELGGLRDGCFPYSDKVIDGGVPKFVHRGVWRLSPGWESQAMIHGRPLVGCQNAHLMDVLRYVTR